MGLRSWRLVPNHILSRFQTLPLLNERTLFVYSYRSYALIICKRGPKCGDTSDEFLINISSTIYQYTYSDDICDCFAQNCSITKANTKVYKTQVCCDVRDLWLKFLMTLLLLSFLLNRFVAHINSLIDFIVYKNHKFIETNIWDKYKLNVNIFLQMFINNYKTLI
jgi:hypothetical protein